MAVGISAATAEPLPESGTYDLASDASARLVGPTGAKRVGWSVSRAGDVNGDGKPDVVIGAPYANVGAARRAGAAYVVFGPVEDLSLAKLGARGFRINGAAAGDWAGWSVTRLGDVNRDGMSDLAVGAPFAARDAGEDAGAAYIVFGKKDSAPVSLGALAGKGLVIAGANANDRSGFSVAAVPDLDGDRRRELAVGAPTTGARSDDHASVTNAPGAAYVVFSKALAGNVALDELAQDGFRMDGWPRSLAGVGVAGIPDLNGDGRGEIIVGAPGLVPGEERSGGAFVVWGKPTPEPIDLMDHGRLQTGFLIHGGTTEGTHRTAARWAGRDVAVLPDIDDDGKAEIIIGAPHTSPDGKASAGAAYVVYGSDSTDGVDLSYLDPAPVRRRYRVTDAGVRLAGAAAGDLTGWSVGPAGDFDDDGVPDVLMGAPGASALSRDRSGVGYVVFGTSLIANVDLAKLGERGVRIVGARAGAHAGRSLANVRDVSGDGVWDVLIGTPGGNRRTGATLLNGPK
jgi:hypothetical protein